MKNSVYSVSDMVSSFVSCARSVMRDNLTSRLVLRYSPYNRAVKQVIDSGVLGEIINIQHIEPVGNQHFAHS